MKCNAVRCVAREKLIARLVAETSRVLRDPTVAKDDSLVVCSTDYRGEGTNTRCIFQSYIAVASLVSEPAMPFFPDEIKCQFKNLSRREKVRAYDAKERS